jgi:aminopeptidase C
MYDSKELSGDAKTAMRVDALMRFSNAHQANAEAARVEAELKETQEVENRKIVSNVLAENAAKAAAEEARLRAQANKNLEEDLRRQFFTANDQASQHDWLMAKDEIMKNYFITRMNDQVTREQIEAQRYPRM